MVERQLKTLIGNLALNHDSNAMPNLRNDEKISLYFDNTRIDVSREDFLKSIEQSIYENFCVSKYIIDKTSISLEGTYEHNKNS
jgi:hypothetical protein